MRISDFPAPDTLAARGALALARQYQSPAITAHGLRSWLWAEAFARVDGITGIDHELLYVAAVLHDIGTVTEFDNHTISYEHAVDTSAWPSPPEPGGPRSVAPGCSR